MSDFYCDVCGEIKMGLRHVCPPPFRACIVDGDGSIPDEDAWQTVRAHDAEFAAEAYCQIYNVDAMNYPYSRTVCVEEDGRLLWFRVDLQMVPEYRAAKMSEVLITAGNGDSRQ
jgi:hypothetical protein